MGGFKSIAKPFSKAGSALANAGEGVAGTIQRGGTRNLEPARLAVNTSKGTFGLTTAVVQGAFQTVGAATQGLGSVLSGPGGSTIIAGLGGAFGVPIPAGLGAPAPSVSDSGASGGGGGGYIAPAPVAAGGGMPSWIWLAAGAAGLVVVFLMLRKKG